MKISINEPCHENWDQMTPNDKGAFCLSCQKNVVDFSSKTIGQIKDFFKKKAENESVCGRFNESQLDDLSFDDFFGRFKKWQFLHRAAVIMFFVFGMALFGNAQSAPKDRPHIKMGAVAYVPQDTTKKICKKDTTQTTMVKGRVKQHTEKPKKQKPASVKMMGDVDVREDK